MMELPSLLVWPLVPFFVHAKPASTEISAALVPRERGLLILTEKPQDHEKRTNERFEPGGGGGGGTVVGKV